MFRRAGLRSLAILLLLATAAAGPATRPATQPSTQPADIARWLKDSASLEPDVRDAARVQLLGLGPEDLPALHEAARSLAPLLPPQIDTLKQIAVYQAARSVMLDQPTTGKGMMGVTLSTIDQFGPPDDQQEKAPVGVTVISRLTGFVAFRYLRDGDLITAFEIDGQTFWFEAAPQLRSLVSSLRVNLPVTIHVRRAGQDMQVTFPIDSGRIPEGFTELQASEELRRLAAAAETEAVQKLQVDFADVLGPEVE